MERPLLTVLTAVIVYGDNKRKCQLPCPAISAHDGHAEWVETRDLTQGNFDSRLSNKVMAL